MNARRAWRGARVRANVVHSSDSALWSTPREGYFGQYVALEEPEAFDSLEARVELVRRYLAAFGPASAQDFRLWAMMRMAEVKPAFERLESVAPLPRRAREGARRRSSGTAPGGGDAGAGPVPSEVGQRAPRVRRTARAIIPEAYRKRVIRMNGDVAQTFLLDGFVAGTWSFEDGRVVAQPFSKLSRAVLRELEEEMARLEAFLAGSSNRG